ncbi:MAG: hypothetical protein WBE73_04325 [Candidatus Acidiferrum sp.]
MKKDRKTRRRSEQGIALLIAIFVLLLVSVVAIALLVSSGTETALGANYRSSSTVYYAALAGLEEARGRLLPKNPNYFGASVPALASGTTLPLGQAIYVLNQLPGETITPWDSSDKYYDNEYASEFGVSASSNLPVLSVWNNSPGGIPGPPFKWVRINAVTEKAVYLDVNGNGTWDAQALFYDPANVDYKRNAWPSMVVGPTSTAVQVLEITALAALPNGSQKMLQYLVAPTTVNLSFPAALTLDGPNVITNPSPYAFTLPWGANFFIDGTDQYFSPGPGGCAAGNPSPSQVRGIGYSNSGGGDMSGSIITSAAGGANHGDYKGLGSASPNVYNVGNSPPPGPPPPPTLPSNLQTLSGVNSVVTSLSQVADVTLSGPVTQSDSNNLMPAAMSATNPMTVVVTGDFTESGWSGTGYGTLLVTGNFTYDENSSWDGVILVIGKGVFYSHAITGGSGTGKIYGAVLIATTVDGSGNPLPSLGSPSFFFNDQGSDGIYYSSCWVQYVQSASKYQVLSFHEIPQS